MKTNLIPKPYRDKLRRLRRLHNETLAAFRHYYREVACFRPWKSIGYYWPGAKDGASFNCKSVYERIKAGEILGYETIISTSGDDLVFHFRKELPPRPVQI